MIAWHRVAGIAQARHNNLDRLIKLLEFLAAVGDGLKVVGERIWQVTSSTLAFSRATRNA